MSSEFKTFCHPCLSCVFKMHTGETRQALLDGSEFLQFLVRTGAELQIRGGIEDNSKIFFLISPRKHML